MANKDIDRLTAIKKASAKRTEMHAKRNAERRERKAKLNAI